MRGADFALIRDKRSRAGARGFLRSVCDSIVSRQPEIIEPDSDPGQYATVILGTPVWGGRVSAPMRMYILGNRDRFREVGLFCTMGGSGGEKVLKEMAALCHKRPVARLVVSDAEILHGRFGQKLLVMQEKPNSQL
jgi:hypothetical protein